MSTKAKVEAARDQAVVDLTDRICSMRLAIQELENIRYAMIKGRLDGLDFRIQDIIDDPTLDRIQSFLVDPDIKSSIRTGLL
jgi:hypothetical protein